MQKKWFAFEIGGAGGISTNAISPPFNSRKEAEAWAAQRCPQSKTGQIGIAELVAFAQRETPPVIFKEVLAFSTDDVLADKAA